MTSQRLPGLDLLRAIAITWVVFFHGGTLGLGWAVEPVSRLGWMGVDLFFVLSGFLIARQWFAALAEGKPTPFADFYRRRAFRILPAYVVVVAVYFALPGLRERRAIQPLWQFFTFTENLFIDVSGGKAFSHVWSLCVEEHFYLAFPVLAWLLLRRPSTRVTVVTWLALVLGGFALRTHQWFDVVAPAGDDLMPRYYENIYYPTLTRLDGLLVGVALAVIEARRPQTWAAVTRRPLVVLLVGASLFGVAVVLCDGGETALAATLGFPAVALAMGCFVTAAASPRARVDLPGAATLATVSYSVYLSHKLALHALQVLAGSWLASRSALAVACYAVAVLVVGFALHHAVERPFLRLRARNTTPVIQLADSQ